MICNLSKCKEIIFRKKGFIQDIAQVNNIRQCRRVVNRANMYMLS